MKIIVDVEKNQIEIISNHLFNYMIHRKISRFLIRLSKECCNFSLFSSF